MTAECDDAQGGPGYVCWQGTTCSSCTQLLLQS